MKEKAHKVYLVGAGPGNPAFITVKGLEIVRQADVVIHDYLVDNKLLEETKEGAELISCGKLGKKKYSHSLDRIQESINKIMVEKAMDGKKVVRLKNGDPSIFSRISEELEALIKNRLEFEIVPGVTSASLASSLTGVSLTDRRFSSSVIFVTGHEDPNKKISNINWKDIAACPTIVLYMAVKRISEIAEKLIRSGRSRSTAVVVICFAGRLNPQTVTAELGDIAKIVSEKKISPPAIFIIGEVSELEKNFNWFRKNRRILFTGLSRERFFMKGTYVHLPMIRIEPISDYAEFDGYLKKIAEFDWLVFTSRYSVKYFFKRLKVIGYDTRMLQGILIAAIGNSTKRRLEDFGITADLVPEKESSIGLLEEFKKNDLENKKIFLPRSDLSDKGLTHGFKKLGAEVRASIAYKNVIPENLPDIDLYSFDEVMFTSPSGVRNFIKRYGSLPEKVKVRCIGDVTLKQARNCHLKPKSTK